MFSTFVWLVALISLATAQNSEPAHPAHDMSQMNMEVDEAAKLPSPHAGTGTGWQPASVPAHEWMFMRGGWDLMAHGVIFADYNQQGGPRGAGKAESVNYGMLMEGRNLGSGSILFREMFSAESLTSPHPGFPELFQTGETYHDRLLIDHQHPHNVFAELAALYTVPLTTKISWELYGGPSAEPALGPVTYIHRASAAELPMAPLSHHLQDSTHTSFGVVTTGFVIDRVKLEASAFNGREPNEQRWSIQFAALDSWSGRASIAPRRNWTAQYSIGRLEHPEALEPVDSHELDRTLDQTREVGGRHGGESVTAQLGTDQAEWMDSEHFPGQARKPQLAKHLGAREGRIGGDHRSIESADADADQPGGRVDAGFEQSQKRAYLGGPSSAASAKDPDSPGPAAVYVPSSQELKYLTCSSVKVSMATPIASNFNLATSASISLGTS